MTLLLQVSWLLPPWPRYSSIMDESIKNQRWNNSEPSKQQWQQITNPYNSASQVFVELKFETPTAFFSVKVTKDIGHHIFAPKATLFRDSLAQQENCHHCLHETQTLKHHIVISSFVQTLWNQFALWWNGKNPNLIILSEEEIITLS